uniref:Sodium:solute symporter family protein n=1 Tax=Candidatus Kentrum sp. SD TaxID=2126332 RepID=A0A450YB39_9GAMM|nr:MAG: Sodium:solute symporter family protein [Candidatus Kentron sp. SD]VFK43382.1 MAG: Sodium:solute symporter family protein [Candidatus Kentron sp. SD]
MFFLLRYLRSGIASIPEFLEKRFGSTTRAISSLIFIVAYAGILLPIILYTGAIAPGGIFDIQVRTGLEAGTVLWITVCFAGVIGAIHAILGGLRAVAVSDTLNGFGPLVGRDEAYGTLARGVLPPRSPAFSSPPWRAPFPALSTRRSTAPVPCSAWAYRNRFSTRAPMMPQ